MIVKPGRAALRALRERDQVWLPDLSFDAGEVLAHARRDRFGGRHGEFQWGIAQWRSLACIVPAHRVILLHPLMNHPTVPECVIRHVFTHELIHLEIPPEDRSDGTSDSHPPAFWEMERALSPDRSEAIAWVWDSWGPCLRTSRRQQGVLVKRDWRRFLGVCSREQSVRLSLAKYAI